MQASPEVAPSSPNETPYLPRENVTERTKTLLDQARNELQVEADKPVPGYASYALERLGKANPDKPDEIIAAVKEIESGKGVAELTQSVQEKLAALRHDLEGHIGHYTSVAETGVGKGLGWLKENTIDRLPAWASGPLMLGGAGLVIFKGLKGIKTGITEGWKWLVKGLKRLAKIVLVAGIGAGITYGVVKSQEKKE
ncbi:hypothetical protein A3C52_03115 [Candidatus Peribacteria bacterium RIFCSPHIGHO2_02_FULL_51_15]|nr:MAG: hypothetical protein A3C52_03115 [Candidatus Peribacteria bacterium RIFCSPHIGHO2_02_FULL_51_15]